MFLFSTTWITSGWNKNSTSGGECNLAKEPPQKTLSVMIRRQRDCDSRWVADSVSEVSLLAIVVFMIHNCRYGVMVS